jgi:hypothetical protein
MRQLVETLVADAEACGQERKKDKSQLLTETEAFQSKINAVSNIVRGCKEWYFAFGNQ